MNGNVKVSIDEYTGTKTREWEDEQSVEFPESLDIKITNWCDKKCPYCHEESVLGGKHGNLTELFEKIKCLPAGVEVAIGGGNPLDHPSLPGFLRECKKHGFIVNLTVNQYHINKDTYFYQVRSMIRMNMIDGLGISLHDANNLENLDYLCKYSNNVVIHTIVGVTKFDEDIPKLAKALPYLKLLVLGYKSFGRGTSYEAHHEPVNLELLKESCSVISFDNLAIEQLGIKDNMSDDDWSKYYQGDEFTTSMYIDAVKGEYAPTSRSAERTSWNMNLIDYFKNTNR